MVVVEAINIPPFLFGVPGYLEVQVELKPKSNTWEWTSPEAIDGEEDDITFKFSGDIID